MRIETPEGIVQVESLDEAAAHIASLAARVYWAEVALRDHAQRWDTLQTPWWKRIWFWIDGWPWYDLNGVQVRRPWHRRDR